MNLTVGIRETLDQDGALHTWLDLANEGTSPVGRDWRLYFSMGLAPLAGEHRVRRELLEGRYGYIAPTDDWQDLAAGETRCIPIEAWLFSGMELIARQGFHLVRLEDGKEISLGVPGTRPPVLVPLTEPRSPGLEKMSPASIREPRDETPGADTPAQPVIPAVKEYVLSPEQIEVTGLAVSGPGVPNEVDRLREYITDMGIGEGGLPVELTLDPGLASDYTIETDIPGCTITGQTPAMLFQGIQAFRQLLCRTGKGWQLPKISITDYADFEHRCLFLDIARHFHTAEQIRKVIDAMARYRMNRLQLGISNDEGWRLEIAALPALTTIGSVRSYRQFDEHGKRRALAPAWGDGPDDYGGFLSTNDFIELLRYAGERHIEVIPEVNLPGHANALIRSLEDSEFTIQDPKDTSMYQSAQGYRGNVINPALPDTWKVIRLIVSGIRDMYRLAGIPLQRIHLGGDEVPEGVWTDSPVCRQLPVWNEAGAGTAPADRAAALMRFHVQQLMEIITETVPGTEVGFWHEMSPHVDGDAYFTVWTTEKGNADPLRSVVSREQALVICNASYLYLDMPHGMAANEPGLPWAAYVDTKSIFDFDAAQSWDIVNHLHLVRGLQAQLWSETVFDGERMDYSLFPRLLAVAERAWNRVPVTGTWPAFLKALSERELPWLASRGIRFRPLFTKPGQATAL